jgi:NADH:ubiquinone oxidoreductase subunit F (NADH-binding)/NADH:ubiquinone oxidoreductase subunit E
MRGEDPSPELTEVLAPFPRARTWLLPALRAAQEALGYLPAAALAQVAAHLRVPLSEVWGVATGYPELRLAPRGHHHARVCTGVSCALLGGGELLAEAARRHGAAVGDTGADRALTLESADCFFECSMAPMIEVDGAYHGRVAPDDVAHLDRWFRAHAHLPAAPRGSARAVDAAPAVTAPAESAEAALDRLAAAADMRRRGRPALRLSVQMGTCGRAVNAEDLLVALHRAVAAARIDAEVVAGACNGMCYAAPSIEISHPGWPRAVLERVTAAALPALLDALAGDGPLGAAGIAWSETAWRGLVPAARHPFWAGQERALLARSGAIDPESLDDALLHGAYRALARALDRPPLEVIEAVKASGLLGRGGAFFPTASKWEACRGAAGEPKYIVANGEEGEPGIFKDRHLMEGDPHQLVEGALIAAYATGASRVILYVHGEADLSAERLGRAVAQAEEAGLVGTRVLGRDFACAVELRRGAGGFVLGEETALLESIEGRRAQPRTRPPFPVESGLWGKPTVINNVETLSAIPSIVGRGAAWFAGLGTPKSPGTKVFGLSGPIARPGVVEVRSGVTLQALIETIGGGLTGGRAGLGAVVGGPSGSIVPAALFDVVMEPRGRVSPGTGGIVAVPEGASVVEIVKTLLRFNAQESCGKCTPCREGTPRLLALIEEMERATVADGHTTRANELAEAIQLASLCGLGQAAPLALLRALETFPDEMAGRS